MIRFKRDILYFMQKAEETNNCIKYTIIDCTADKSSIGALYNSYIKMKDGNGRLVSLPISELSDYHSYKYITNISKIRPLLNTLDRYKWQRFHHTLDNSFERLHKTNKRNQYNLELIVIECYNLYSMRILFKLRNKIDDKLTPYNEICYMTHCYICNLSTVVHSPDFYKFVDNIEKKETELKEYDERRSYTYTVKKKE